MFKILTHEPDFPQTSNSVSIWSPDVFQDGLTFISSLDQIGVLVTGPLV